MEQVVPHGQNDLFSRSNEPRESKPPLHFAYFLVLYFTIFFQLSQFALIAKTTNFKGQTNPRTSVKTLAMESFGPYGQNIPFAWSNEPHSRANCPSQPKRPIFKVKRASE
ncbi:hypothetical protein H5410_044073 [Solanum commersonii]|uniref:Uncharacterized protein n=1 Tax=Solanum commersonii TaxID=4109 RepID=A0A9J5Y135_SOLCO|nr:hypothetical protein H5410_044073 [Solanum commersonii]